VTRASAAGIAAIIIDASGQLVDPPSQSVDLIENDPGEFAVVGVERFSERFDQGQRVWLASVPGPSPARVCGYRSR
jgi:hypothetical protein